MGNFFAELKRRHIYRVAAAYAVVAWLLIQIINNIAPIFELPNYVARAFVLLLAIGFPIAIIVACMIELKTAEGSSRAKALTIDLALAGIAVVVIAIFGYQQFGARATAPRPQAGVEAASTAAARPTGVSLVVLPFDNISGDPTQEFFSNGMTEEITAALAKVPDLRIVARSSAAQFKAQNRDIQSIGEQLHATHFIEGSVRMAGTRVRITAQLIKTDDGTHIWTENYDRELTDVFAIQEDIATAIASALRMPLGLKPGERLVSSRSIDAESYQQYLRAKVLMRARAAGVPQATEILEPLVERNPDYAPAWAQLATAYGSIPNYHRNGSIAELRSAVDEFLPKGETASRRAIQLDTNLADGYVALGRVQIERGKFLLSEELFSKALVLDANNPDALSQYSNLLAVVGRLKEALAMKQQLLALEPFVPAFNADVAEVLLLNGQNDVAIPMLKESSGTNPWPDLAVIYAAMGRYSEAADALQKIPPGGIVTPEMVSTAARLIRAAPAEAASPQNLPRLGRLSFVYLYVGVPNRALEYFEDAAEAGFFAIAGSDNAFLWHPSYAPVRKTERFKAFVRKDGLVDYWRAKGWPEFCHPTTGDDFVCS